MKDPADRTAAQPAADGSERERHRRIIGGVLVGAALCFGASQANAQAVNSYFPAGTYGFDREIGVTVLSREQPLYASPGVMAGAFTIRPRLAEQLFFNSNPTGAAQASGSGGVRTSAAITADSNWNRNSLGVAVGVDDHRYFVSESGYTDWNVGVHGGYTIEDSQLAAAYSHQEYHQLGTAIASVATQTPILDTTDTARMSYTINVNRFAFTPDISYSAYRFGTATVAGAQLDQSYLNRNVLAGGLATRYSMSDVGGLLFILRASSDDYLHRLAGQPTNNSTSLGMLAGFDYQAKGPWRYRFLMGVEEQSYQASQYSTQTALLVEGSVIWTPSGVTTVTGSISRSIESPQSSNISGFVLTSPRLTVDFELQRNIILQGRGGIQYAEFPQGGGNQTNYTAGASANWLINSLMRLSLDVDYIKQIGNSQPTSATSTQLTGAFNQTVVALTLHIAL